MCLANNANAQVIENCIDIEFHFQEGFKNQEIQLLENDVILLNEKVTTDDQSGLALITKIEWCSDNKYTVIAGKDSVILTPWLKSKYIRITYDPAYSILLEYSQTEFIYD